jgi:hypothetical protein
VVGNAVQHIGEPSLRIDAAELGHEVRRSQCEQEDHEVVYVRL